MMTVTRLTLTDLRDLADLPCDDVIDVRAPAEFAEDHIPNAISLPVLSDAERAKVGTIYVQQTPFLARKIGAALVAKNASLHLQGPLADRPGGWRPLVYCWRGGQRSGSFASILDQIGWRVSVLDGGYKAYRRMVVKALYDSSIPSRIILLDGGTGTGKTALLHHLVKAGAQVLDLEALAQHRGSLLGGFATGQPSQKAFESKLAMALTAFDPRRPVFVEAESNKIGRLILPPSLWKTMLQADHLRVSAPLSARGRYLCETYADVMQDRSELQSRLHHLTPFHGKDTVARWQSLAEEGCYQPLAEALVAQHYDPSYRRASKRAGPPLAEITMAAIEAKDLARAADEILTRIGS